MVEKALVATAVVFAGFNSCNLYCSRDAPCKQERWHLHSSSSDYFFATSSYVLLSVLLNFVFVILYRENFANRLNYPYYSSAMFNILLGGGLTPFVPFIGGFCSPLFTIYTYDAS